jgi:uncharacterized protein DUF3306
MESIAAGGNVRAFLRPGVPTELACRALRIAWTADPAIREFVGVADNDWDFNVQGGIPGFGVIEPADFTRGLNGSSAPAPLNAALRSPPDIEVQVTSSEILMSRK